MLQQAVHFALSAVLMRLLDPEAFGVVAMALVFTGFGTALSELGFGSALVQRRDLEEEHRSTAFWLICLSGVAYGIALSALAPLIAAFYARPSLAAVVVWSAAAAAIAVVGSVPRALLQRAMRLDLLSKIDMASMFLSSCGAVGVAFAGGGVWSLVTQHVLTAVLTTGMLFLVGSWRPRRIWSGDALRDLWSFGAGLTAFNAINYWARSADRLLIGKLLGAAPLGLYTRAHDVTLLPLTQMAAALSPVMFPALSTIKDDRPRVRGAFLRLLSLSTFVMFPTMFGIMVVAEPFVMVFFGDKWESVVPLIQILAVVGMTQTLCKPVGWIYMSQGRTDWLFRWGLFGSTFRIGCLTVGVLLGTIESVAWSYLVGNLIVTLPCLLIPGRLIDMSLSDVWRAVRGNLLSAFVMAVAVWRLSVTIRGTASPLVELVAEVALGIVVYSGLVYACRNPVLLTLNHFRRQLQGQQPVPSPIA